MFIKAAVVAFVASSIYFLVYKKDVFLLEESDAERNIIAAWSSLIKLPSKSFERLVVGVNSNVDLIVSGVDLLKALKLKPGEAQNLDQLNSLNDLQDIFNFFFTKGSAAERAFLNEEVYKQITRTAESLEDAQFYIGGNAALMATKISSAFPNVKIQYIGPVGPKLRDLLPQSLIIPEASNIPVDEIHLIMEYQVGEKWGDNTAPVATRFITSFDESNSKATMIETFFENVKPFDPDLILLSGLHLLEGQSQEFFSQRLAVIRNGLNNIPRELPVHLELASMANKKFVKEILEQITPAINSLGLNEQELSFSAHAGNGPHPQQFAQTDGQPDVHKISDMILWVLKTFGYSKSNPDSKLSRVHFHSLTYHIIGTYPGVWKNSPSAVAAGTRMAGMQACDVDIIDPDSVSLKFPKKFYLHTGSEEIVFNASNPVISWQREGFEFSLSPVLVCKKPLKTVGLGDSISATGLMYSEFNKMIR
ncbi:hypothetical protein FSP39_014684 [Pinctada imbricata]|uniref:ADP-dependent glucokinase n=1 Tax=Pinctada imbricata TaxID=66713 RepID=A0AA88YF24_PINIB|nr:hypothetical protein FSP39_014684 [Pinctada imbricata]